MLESSSSYVHLLDHKGIVHGHYFDRAGHVYDAGWARVKNWQPGEGFLWLHLDRNDSGVRTWLEADSGLERGVREALLVEEPHPHSLIVGDALVVFLRGVNLNPNANPDDLVTVRIWLEVSRVISLRGPRLLVAQDIDDRIKMHGEPATAGDFLVIMVSRLLDRLGSVLEEMEDQLDSLEEDLLDNALNKEFRSTLRRLRRQSIALRRYIAPQSNVISNLAQERVSWLTDLHRARLRELAQRNLRYVEDLGAMRERIIVIDEELSALTNEQINHTIFILSIITAIFLPLSFVTGLLGINVGGIPGATSEWGFIGVCAFLALIVGLELLLIYQFLKKRQV
ncbi:MAG: zinc transporter ZntB [Anaerolineales bacterium]|nr:zinc transporter ZntB [Anaerolineales bacterium]